MVKRIRLRFTSTLEIDFVDRDLALKRVEEWASKGTRFPVVVYGPEGCGKTAWLRQSAEILREAGYNVIYVDPIHKDFTAYTDLSEVVKRLAEAVADVVGAELRLAMLVVDLVKHMIKSGKKRVAILVDDAFQAIGLNRAAIYIKSLLGLIEYPPGDYEKIVAIVTTSEGVSRKEIGRHRWAELLPMWNMAIDGFKQLYNMIPGDKPLFDDVWRLAGGNPWMLARLYESNWNVEQVVDSIVKEKNLIKLISQLSNEEKRLLAKSIDNPDALMSREGMQLLNKLVELNLMIDDLHFRKQIYWIDKPPPEEDLQLGIGRVNAWQTPIYREAIKKALKIVN